METNIKSCKGLAEIAVVEFGERDVVIVGKRMREVGDVELDSGYVDLRNTRRRLLSESEATTSASDLSPQRLTCSFSAQLEDQATISDLQVQGDSAQAETLTFYGAGRASSNRWVAEGSGNLESTVVQQMPLGSEMEEFFTAAEQHLHKRFSHKYNFDCKNGVPLEGRFEWVPVHHEWP